MTDTSFVLEPKIEAYGTYGRESALADYVEFRALARRAMSQSDLQDLIDDMGWGRKGSPVIIGLENDDRREPSSEVLAKSAFSLIKQRSDVLAEQYPFRLNKFGKLTWTPGPRVDTHNYCGLLAICIAHAWQVPCPNVDPKKVFEAVVVEALSHVVPSVGVGTGGRGAVGFVQALHQATGELGLAAQLSPEPRSASAKDAGVDVLTAHVWQDSRKGHWVFIGQVTCAKTDQWRSKFSEPVPGMWEKYLLEPYPPTRFLAVPHHVLDAHFNYSQVRGRGALLDRLRLTLVRQKVTPEELTLLDAVISAKVE